MFQGFSDETFEFFMAIRFNNNRDFFHANRDWYLRSVRGPCLALAEALESTIEWLDEDLERRPNRVVSRINRDIRFSHNKAPYRDYIWLAYRRPGVERCTTMGVFFDISDDGASYGMGYYGENRLMMNALRRQIDMDPKPLLEAWTPVREEFLLYAKNYRRMTVPDSVPEALRPLYTAKGFYFEKSLTDFALLKSPALVDELCGGFRRLAPLYGYLNALTPEESTEDVTKV